MAAILNPGMRAVTVDINRSSGIAGFIYPGDRVDVIMTHRVRIEELENSSRRARTRRQNYNLSETILSNVRVLGVDQISEKDKAGAKVRRTATLEVTPKIAEKLSVMRRVGQLSLSLRSLAREDGTAPTDSTTPPIGDTISTTQAGELSSFLPKIGDKPPRKEIVVDRGNRREVINLAKNPDDENEVNSLTIDRPRNDDGIESRNDDGIE
jgi:pilus assembly protein CpaB